MYGFALSFVDQTGQFKSYSKLTNDWVLN